MRIVLALVFVLVALATVEAKCNKCNRNECECQLKIVRGPQPQPFPFYKKKKCNVTKPLEFKPKPDVCSCEQEYRIRPLAPDHVEPKFAKSRSCECGFEQHPDQPKRKYPADLISYQLAQEYAKMNNVPEAGLYMHHQPAKPAPVPKHEGIPEERMYKANMHVLELKPHKRKRFNCRICSSEEEEGAPCNPKHQNYFDICYGKVENKEPKFNVVKQDAPVCDRCQDRSSTEEDESTEEDFSPEQPTKHCSKCSKQKKTCDCPSHMESYEPESEEYDCPFAKKYFRKTRSSDDPEPALVV
ncbi:uncharacterized protein LOC128709103 [Anopheles marshallii]|uniref:uncharacterized protein LOC128709103 n=1 Tax=Anopheles marshallii TaxID=1521116 RepID=UPI00237B0D62|nr:uncharacterized protein LOC128709103 [Anopheles marshallii]